MPGQKLGLLQNTYFVCETFNNFLQMRYPTQVLIQGNTQQPGFRLVIYNRLANVDGRQQSYETSFRENHGLAFAGMWS